MDNREPRTRDIRNRRLLASLAQPGRPYGSSRGNCDERSSAAIVLRTDLCQESAVVAFLRGFMRSKRTQWKWTNVDVELLPESWRRPVPIRSSASLARLLLVEQHFVAVPFGECAFCSSTNDNAAPVCSPATSYLVALSRHPLLHSSLFPGRAPWACAPRHRTAHLTDRLFLQECLS